MAKVSIAVFRDYMRSENAEAQNVTRLQAALDAADLAIDLYCGRAINAPAAVATARTFRPATCYVQTLPIDDCTTITSVAENGTTLVANVDYAAQPLNGRTMAGETRPYSSLARQYQYWLHVGVIPTVTVTATWGWATIPAPVAEACKMLGKDIATSRERVGDAAGFGDYGMVRLRQSPYITALLAPYQRAEAMAIG